MFVYIYSVDSTYELGPWVLHVSTTGSYELFFRLDDGTLRLEDFGPNPSINELVQEVMMSGEAGEC